jgi:hypothetical protein
MPRTIKLGRKSAGWPALHWAIKVGSTWYEIVGKGANNGEKGAINVVNRSYGDKAASGAGFLGGEIVGETTKSDEEIDTFIDGWLANNHHYELLIDNCQKFAYEFVVFLTDGVNFRLPHRFDAAVCAKGLPMDAKAFAVNQDGIAIARLGMGETRASLMYWNALYRGPSYEAAAVAGAGLGAWVGASPLGRAEVNMGPLLGVHLEPNLNTGLGVRDGNVDVHLLGFGARHSVHDTSTGWEKWNYLLIEILD